MAIVTSYLNHQTTKAEKATDQAWEAYKQFIIEDMKDHGGEYK